MEKAGTDLAKRIPQSEEKRLKPMTSNSVSTVLITLCDNLNPGFGYQIRIQDQQGKTLLFTSRDPSTGKDLLTLGEALLVASYYAK